MSSSISLSVSRPASPPSPILSPSSSPDLLTISPLDQKELFQLEAESAKSPKKSFPISLTPEHLVMMARGIVNELGRLKIPESDLPMIPALDLETVRLVVDFLKEELKFPFQNGETLITNRAQLIVYLKQESKKKGVSYQGTFLKGGHASEILANPSYLKPTLTRLDKTPEKAQEWITAEGLKNASRKAPDSDVQSLFPTSEKSDLEKTIVQIFHTHVAELVPDQEEDQKTSLGRKIFLVRQHSFKRPSTTWSGLTRYVKLIFNENVRPTDWLLVQSTDRPGLFLHRTLQIPLDELAQAIVNGVSEENWPAVIPTIPQPRPGCQPTLSQHWQALVSLYLQAIHIDELSSLNRFALASLIVNYSEGFFNGEPGFELYLIKLLTTFYQKKEAPENETLADRLRNRVTHQILKRVSSLPADNPFEAPIYLWNCLQFLSRYQIAPEIIKSISNRCQKPMQGTLPSLLNFLQKAQQFKELSHADLTLCLQFLAMPLIGQKLDSDSPIACKVIPLGNQSVLAVSFQALKRTLMLPVPNKETFSRFRHVLPYLSKEPEVVQSLLKALLELWKNNPRSSNCLYQEKDLWLAVESKDPIEALCGSWLYLTGRGEPDQREILLLLSAMKHLFQSKLPQDVALYWLNQIRELLKRSSLPEFAEKSKHLFIQLEHNLNEAPFNPRKSLFEWLNTLVLAHQECLNPLAYSLWLELAELSDKSENLRNDTIERSLQLVNTLKESAGGFNYAIQAWENLTSKISSHQTELLDRWIELAQSCPSNNFSLLQKLVQGAPLWKKFHPTSIPANHQKQFLISAIEKLGTALPYMDRCQFYLDCVTAKWIDIESQENHDLLVTLSHGLIPAVGVKRAAEFWKRMNVCEQQQTFAKDSLISPILQSLACKLEEQKLYTECDEIAISFSRYPAIIESSIPIKNLILNRLETIILEKGIEAAQQDPYYMSLLPIIKNHPRAEQIYEKAFLQSITNNCWKEAYSQFFNIPVANRTINSLIKLTRLISQAPATEAVIENFRALSKCETVKSKKLSSEQIEFKCLFLKRLWMEEGVKARTEWLQIAADLIPHLSFLEPHLEQTESFYGHFIEVISKIGDPRMPFPANLRQNLEQNVEKIFRHLKTICPIQSFRTLHLHFSFKKLTARLLTSTTINWSVTLADPKLQESVNYLFSCVKLLPKEDLSGWSKSISEWICFLYEHHPTQAHDDLDWWLETVIQSHGNQLKIDPSLITLRRRINSNLAVKLCQSGKDQLPAEEESFLWLSETVQALLSDGKDADAYGLLIWIKEKSVKDKLFLRAVEICQRHASHLLYQANPTLPLSQILKLLVDFFPNFSPEWEAVFTLLSTSKERPLLQQAWNRLLAQTVCSPYSSSGIACWEIVLENGLSSQEADLYWSLIDVATLLLLKEKFTSWKQLSKWQILCLLVFQEGIKFPNFIKNMEEHHLFLGQLHTLLKEDQLIQQGSWEIKQWLYSLLAQNSISILRVALEFALKELNLSEQPSLCQKIYEAIANHPSNIQCPTIYQNLMTIVKDTPRPTFKEKWLILSALKNVKGSESIATSLLVAQELIQFLPEDCPNDIELKSISDYLTDLIRLANRQHREDYWIAINTVLQSPEIQSWLQEHLCKELLHEYRLERVIDARRPEVSAPESMKRLIAYSFDSSLLNLPAHSLKMDLHTVTDVMLKFLMQVQTDPTSLNQLEKLASAIVHQLAPNTIAVYFNHPDAKVNLTEFVTAALTSDLAIPSVAPEQHYKSSFFRIQWLNKLLDIKKELSNEAAHKVFEWIETHLTDLIKDAEKYPIIRSELETVFEKAFLNKNLFKHNFSRANELFSLWWNNLASAGYFPLNRPIMLQAALYIRELTTRHKEVDLATHAEYIHVILTRLSALGPVSFLKSTAIFLNAQNAKFGTTKDIMRWFKVLMNHWKNLPSPEINQWNYIHQLFATFLPGELSLSNVPGCNLEATFKANKPELTLKLIIYPILDQMCSTFSIGLMERFTHFLPWKNENYVDRKIFFQFIFIAINYPLRSGTYIKRLDSYLAQVEKFGDFILTHFKSPKDWKELYSPAISFINLIQNITHFDSMLNQEELYAITKTLVDWFFKLKRHPHLTEKNFEAYINIAHEYVKPFFELDPAQNRRLDKILSKIAEVKPQRKKKQKARNYQ